MSPPTVTEQWGMCVSVRNWAREASKTGGFHQIYSKKIRRVGLNFMDAEDAEELEFLLN